MVEVILGQDHKDSRKVLSLELEADSFRHLANGVELVRAGTVVGFFPHGEYAGIINHTETKDS